MPYREKENVVNIFSGIAIMVTYAIIVYQKHLSGAIDLTNDLKMWGKIFLIFIVVSIVARILIYIIFHIINAIATRDDKIPKEDERDKLIKLKSTRNSHFFFSGGFVIGMVALSIGLPIYWLFIIFAVSGLISEIVDNASQMYYYRKGV